MVEFILNRVFFPFDIFSSSRIRFPFESPRQEILMRRSVSAIFSAAASVYSNTAGNFGPLKFVRVNLPKLGLNLPKWKLPLSGRLSEKDARPSLEFDSELPESHESRLSLSKIIAIIPKFPKKENQLSLQKMKEFRSGGAASVLWLDYDPRFELSPSSANFSLTPFDTIVHDFGLQSYLIRALTEFLLKYSNSLRVSSDSQTRASLEMTSQISNSEKTHPNSESLVQLTKRRLGPRKQVQPEKSRPKNVFTR